GSTARIDGQGIYVIPGDPTSGGEWPYVRGAYIEHQPGGNNVSGAFLVTKFTFVPVGATIDAVRVAGDHVQIDYTAVLSGAPVSAFLESSAFLTGPYDRETSAELTPLGQDKTRATVPINARAKFFRVVLE